MTTEPTTITTTSRMVPPAETRGFTGRFVPGLVIGLIVGALAGSFFGTIIGEGGGGAKVVRPKGVAGTQPYPRDMVPEGTSPDPDPDAAVPETTPETPPATPAPSDSVPVPAPASPPATPK